MIQQAVAATSKQMGAFNLYQMNNLINVVGGKLFLHEPVRNFTFDGIVDELMSATASIPGFADLMPFDKFGWYYTVSIYLLMLNNLTKILTTKFAE